MSEWINATVSFTSDSKIRLFYICSQGFLKLAPKNLDQDDFSLNKFKLVGYT